MVKDKSFEIPSQESNMNEMTSSSTIPDTQQFQNVVEVSSLNKKFSRMYIKEQEFNIYTAISLLSTITFPSCSSDSK